MDIEKSKIFRFEGTGSEALPQELKTGPDWTEITVISDQDSTEIGFDPNMGAVLDNLSKYGPIKFTAAPNTEIYIRFKTTAVLRIIHTVLPWGSLIGAVCASRRA